MQIATWNVNSLAVRLPQVLDWLAANPGVEVLGLQETKLSDDKFPVQAFADAGWVAPLGAEYRPTGPTSESLGWMARWRQV